MPHDLLDKLKQIATQGLITTTPEEAREQRLRKEAERRKKAKAMLAKGQASQLERMTKD